MTGSTIMKRILAVLTVLVLVGWLALPFFTRGQEKKRDDFQEKKRDEFAPDRFPGGGVGKPVAFDGKRAMGYLNAICDLGPRMSGTPAMRKQQELIRKHFEGLGCTVHTQNFEVLADQLLLFRSEDHTPKLQSPDHLVSRLL